MAQSVQPGDINTLCEKMKRLSIDPACGVRDPKETVLLAVTCDTFKVGQEDIKNNRNEWTNTFAEAAKQFYREWFQGNGSRKNKP
uniref:Uncharacterized protein n=1 Tax=Panagrolaimus sp. PS1159 TaxID=55785 RepID=A0AC35FS38_9BILA